MPRAAVNDIGDSKGPGGRLFFHLGWSYFKNLTVLSSGPPLFQRDEKQHLFFLAYMRAHEVDELAEKKRCFNTIKIIMTDRHTWMEICKHSACVISDMMR